MISLLEGMIQSAGNGEAIVMTPGGVGYKIFASPRLLDRCTVGSRVVVDTYLIVREDTLDLFGFADTKEKELFKNFLSVSGVGPKTALHLLALGSVSEITTAIGRSDIEYLTKVSGIGKKTAERIVVELKTKLGEASIGNQESPELMGGTLADVVDGLIALGYSATEARDVAKTLTPTGKTSEQLLKEALQGIK
jgi:Holliday junction DNA helicase RuvA